jgi:hypothetical protein
LCELVPVVVGL